MSSDQAGNRLLCDVLEESRGYSELNGPFVGYHRASRTSTVDVMDSSGRFSSRKHNLLYDALQASGQSSGDYSDFNRCMSEAKSKGLTWVQGLDYTVKKLQPVAIREGERKRRQA